MRTHRTYPIFDLWNDAGLLGRVVSAETLAMARVEPMMRQANGFGVIDLTFVRDGEVAVVPFLHVEAGQLAEPERAPIVWPRSAAGGIADDVADAIEALLLPKLLARYLGRRFNREALFAFAGAAEFDAARRYGFLGAAPYARVVTAAAPYVYAATIAADRRVAVVDEPHGATGAAMLARSAAIVQADFGDAAALSVARAWFGDVFATVEACDVAIGPAGAALPDAPTQIVLHAEGPDAIPIARAIPIDVMFSFDPDDSDQVDAFSIDAPEPELRRTAVGTPAAVGGSEGRLLFVVRGDGLSAGDSDTDDAQALALRLRAEGFTVDVVAASAVQDVGRCDLLHVFNLTAAAELMPVLKQARAAGLPIVATARLDDIAREGVWGARVTAGAARVTTDDQLEDQLAAVAARAIETVDAKPGGQEPFAGYAAGVRAALSLCDAVLVSGPEEERFVRETGGYDGAVVPVGPALYPEASAAIGALVGSSDFALAHAPIAAAGNLFVLVRAAGEAGLPLVIAGPVADAGYLSLLREAAGPTVAFLTRATEEQIRTLYRRARVYADVAWEDRGPARAAAAVTSGAALVLAQSHYASRLWWPGLWSTDRASIPAVAASLREAWDAAGTPDTLACARRAAAYCDPVMGLAGVVGAYAHAQTLRAKG